MVFWVASAAVVVALLALVVIGVRWLEQTFRDYM